VKVEKIERGEGGPVILDRRERHTPERCVNLILAVPTRLGSMFRGSVSKKFPLMCHPLCSVLNPRGWLTPDKSGDTTYFYLNWSGGAQRLEQRLMLDCVKHICVLKRTVG
jgi:hypothetical protein